MTDLTGFRVRISPRENVKRHYVRWPGMEAETVQFTGRETFEYDFQAPVHLFIAYSRALRKSGETRIDGVAPSSLRNFSQRMCLVPAGHRFSGNYEPQILPRSTYFYLDPARLPVDPESGLGDVDFSPRLFFEDPALWSTATKLSELIEAPDAGNLLYAEALSAVLAIELVRLHRGLPVPLPPSRGGLAPWQKRAVCEYIEENLAGEVSLLDLATLTRLSPNHFSRAFKQTLGMPPHRYQNHRRIERAKGLLADPDASIITVAFACGFSFPGNFATTFRKHTGISPSEYRRLLK